MSRPNVSLGLIFFIFLPLNFAYANTLEIAPTLYLFNYQEFDSNNDLLEKEEGELVGVKLSYSDVTEIDTLRFDAAFYGGTVDFDGSTNLGARHQTETDEQIIKLGLTYIQHRNTSYPGYFFAGLHYWHWDRDVLTRNTVQGLHGQYSWYETELGLKFEFPRTSRSGYWVDLSAMYNFKPEMDLILPSGQVKFSLQSRPGYRIRAGKNWAASENMTTTISLFAEYWEFGKSDPVSVADFYGSPEVLFQPDSESSHSGLEFSFQYSF